MNLRGVGRRYGLGGTWVLRGVDLELPAHALVRIEGGNGTGKSTLLRLLAGIDAPTEGRIIGRWPRTAYVPERFPAALPFTATGYLIHLGRVHGLPTARAAARASEWLERFGAAGHARTPLAELSKGTSQKVALAQAFLADPELLVLDEAWTGLDAGARDGLDQAVAERVAAGATVVFVDHDPHRLAGTVDASYRLDGRALVRLPDGATPGETAAPRVLIEATGPAGVVSLPAGLPGAPAPEQGQPDGAGRMRLTVGAAHSDALLRTLLTARPPWHIQQVSPDAPGVRREREGTPRPARASAPGAASVSGPAPVAGPVSGPGAHRGRSVRRGALAMAALLRYQAGLLLRSQRWLAPVLLYAAFLAVGVRAGQPVLDSLGYAAAGLLPVTAWFVRLCATQEPPAARTVAAAVVGQARVHLASLLAAVGCAAGLGAVAIAVVLLISEPVSTDNTVDVQLLPAGLAGLLAAACCVLVGAAVGALCTRPFIRRRGWSFAATVLGVLLALVTTGSPAKYAVTGLVSGSLTGTVQLSVVPLAGALALAAAVAGLACRLTSLRE